MFEVWFQQGRGGYKRQPDNVVVAVGVSAESSREHVAAAVASFCPSSFSKFSLHIQDDTPEPAKPAGEGGR